VRSAFCEGDWDLLEQLVLDADADRVGGAFDDYPECVEELNACQWQVIYHGLLGDALFVLSEPVFRNISLDSELSAWGGLVSRD
jgi:hypothetical protein